MNKAMQGMDTANVDKVVKRRKENNNRFTWAVENGRTISNNAKHMSVSLNNWRMVGIPYDSDRGLVC